MAKNNEVKSGVHYWRSRQASSLRIRVGEPENPGGTAEYVQFTPVTQRWDGDSVLVGYLATDHPDANDILAEDGTVEEISQREFEEVFPPAE
jgi:hypothetical protein